MDDFVAELLRRARAADEELARALRFAVEQSTNEAEIVARGTRKYQDRTGALTDSIDGRLTSAGPLRADGVFEATAPHAGYVDGGTRAHEIRPRKAKVLAFERGGRTVFARSVQHPGTRPDGFFQRGAAAAETTLERQAQVGVARVKKALEG